jgi:hypothetical protein
MGEDQGFNYKNISMVIGERSGFILAPLMITLMICGCTVGKKYDEPLLELPE